MDDTDDSGAVRLDPDGPHSPAYTAAVARTWRDAVRVLNHATLPGAGFPGLSGPRTCIPCSPRSPPARRASPSSPSTSPSTWPASSAPDGSASTTAGTTATRSQAALSRAWSATSGIAARDPATDSRDQDDDRASDGDGG